MGETYARVSIAQLTLFLLFQITHTSSSFFPQSHNGGFYSSERRITPALGKQPHIVFILFDDYGWANAGWHRSPPTPEVSTPHLNQLVAEGVELDRHYVYKFCSPTRSAVQSGRNPYHVNNLNLAPDVSNPKDPVSGFAAIPRNMTGIATKLSSVGYRTHMFGKWDAGMATPDHTPHGRGYQTSMHYFHHANNYWNSHVGKCNKTSIVDLWLANEHMEGPAFGFNSTCHGKINVTGEGCQPGPDAMSTLTTDYDGYEDANFERAILDVIKNHNASEPFFLFWAPHTIHTPLQVPQEYFDKFEFIAPTDKPKHNRQIYHAMVSFADASVGNVTNALKAKGMWDDLLLVFSTDNGGPVYANGSAGANNFPFKGGKMNNWEGGIRGNAFASGGFLPKEVRGTKQEGLMCIWDWYSTFSHLAGVDPTDHRAAAAKLPPIDSFNLVPLLFGQNKTSPRNEIPLGTPAVETPQYDSTTVNGLIQGSFKILIGNVAQAGWQGPHYPNSTTNTLCFDTNIKKSSCVAKCDPACLYNIKTDPEERVDLASTQPDKVKSMLQKLDEYKKTAFNPKRGGTDPRACTKALGDYHGFWGPFIQ